MQNPEALAPVPDQWLKRQVNLRQLTARKFTMVYPLPQLSLQGAFYIDVLLNSILLRYPGLPLDLLTWMKVRRHC